MPESTRSTFATRDPILRILVLRNELSDGTVTKAQAIQRLDQWLDCFGGEVVCNTGNPELRK